MRSKRVILAGALLMGCLAACGSESATESEEAVARDAERQPTTQGGVDESSEADGPFVMTAMDVFKITGRGIVVTGVVKSGAISVGETVCIGGGAPVSIKGIEMFRKVLERVSAGDNAGLLFEGLSRDDVKKGDEIRSCS